MAYSHIFIQQVTYFTSWINPQHFVLRVDRHSQQLQVILRTRLISIHPRVTISALHVKESTIQWNTGQLNYQKPFTSMRDHHMTKLKLHINIFFRHLPEPMIFSDLRRLHTWGHQITTFDELNISLCLRQYFQAEDIHMVTSHLSVACSRSYQVIIILHLKIIQVFVLLLHELDSSTRNEIKISSTFGWQKSQFHICL